MKKIFVLALIAISISSTTFAAPSEFERGFNEGKKAAQQSIQNGRIVIETSLYQEYAIADLNKVCKGRVTKITCTQYNINVGTLCVGYCQE